jgi:hypothetical protein
MPGSSRGLPHRRVLAGLRPRRHVAIPAQYQSDSAGRLWFREATASHSGAATTWIDPYLIGDGCPPVHAPGGLVGQGRSLSRSSCRRERCSGERRGSPCQPSAHLRMLASEDGRWSPPPQMGPEPQGLFRVEHLGGGSGLEGGLRVVVISPQESSTRGRCSDASQRFGPVTTAAGAQHIRPAHLLPWRVRAHGRTRMGAGSMSTMSAPGVVPGGSSPSLSEDSCAPGLGSTVGTRCGCLALPRRLGVHCISERSSLCPPRVSKTSSASWPSRPPCDARAEPAQPSFRGAHRFVGDGASPPQLLRFHSSTGRPSRSQ